MCVWDLFEAVALRGLREPYPGYPSLPVWAIFVSSDVLSISIWWQFWQLLKVVSGIPLDAFGPRRFPPAAASEVVGHRDFIVLVTIVYSIVILLRVVASGRAAAEGHDLSKGIV